MASQNQGYVSDSKTSDSFSDADENQPLASQPAPQRRPRPSRPAGSRRPMRRAPPQQQQGQQAPQQQQSGPLAPVNQVLGEKGIDSVGQTAGGLTSGATNTLGNVGSTALQQQGGEKDKEGGKDTLKLRLDLNLDVEITLKARIHGDLELSLL
ncbi:hypothetical protein MKZ38_002261 [Zalerion maritima]|uniref:Uncharacterized protein n=1 Tax=Zalerion maritima TaxID=339359 RepID=A0AAD5WLR0_9PEZI|nr:hypothetical protein MKZ38_002261 [Zalerion maritima]